MAVLSPQHPHGYCAMAGVAAGGTVDQWGVGGCDLLFVLREHDGSSTGDRSGDGLGLGTVRHRDGHHDCGGMDVGRNRNMIAGSQCQHGIPGTVDEP